MSMSAARWRWADVHAALLDVVARERGVDAEAAADYISAAGAGPLRQGRVLMSAHSVESIKQQSAARRLRESLANPVTGALAEDDQTLIKYHRQLPAGRPRHPRRKRRRQKLNPTTAS